MLTKLTKAELNSEVLIKTYQRMSEILEAENVFAFVVEAIFEGEEYSATLSLSLVRLDGVEVDEKHYEEIRKSNLTSEYFVKIVQWLTTYLEETDSHLYKLPIPLGISPVIGGAIPVLELIITRNSEENE